MSKIIKKLTQDDQGYVEDKNTYEVRETVATETVSYLSIEDIDARLTSMVSQKQVDADRWDAQITALQAKKAELLATT